MPIEYGKQTGTGKVADCFGNMQTAFGKSGGPLTHGELGSACADHEQRQHPKYLFGRAAFQAELFRAILQRDAIGTWVKYSALKSGSAAHSSERIASSEFRRVRKTVWRAK